MCPKSYCPISRWSQVQLLMYREAPTLVNGPTGHDRICVKSGGRTSMRITERRGSHA